MKESTLKQDVEWLIKTHAFLAPYGGERGERLLKKFLTIYDKNAIIPILCDLLPQVKPNFKLVIIIFLRFIGDEKIVPILEEYLDLDIPKKYSSYTYFRTEKHFEAILKYYAIGSLGHLENQTAEKILLNHFQNTQNGDVIIDIIHCFYTYKIQSPETLDTIVKITRNSKYKQFKHLYCKLIRKYKIEKEVPNLIERLEKESDDYVLMDIIRTLAQFRTNESMNAIINGFKKVENVYNKLSALKLLGTVDVKLSYNILLESIKPTEQERTRLYALQGLEILRSKKAIEPLLQIIKEDQNCKVRAKALRVVYSIIGKKYAKEYSKYLEENNCPELKIAAIWIIKKHKTIAKPLLLKVIREDKNQLVRKAAVLALVNYKAKDVIKELKKLVINDNEREIRKAALFTLERILGTEFETFQINAINWEKDSYVRIQQVRSLAKMNTEKSITALLGFLKSEQHKRVKEEIIIGLGKTRRKKITKDLLEIFLKEKDSYFQFFAANAILKTDDSEAIKVIRDKCELIQHSVLTDALKDRLKEYDLFYKRGHELRIL